MRNVSLLLELRIAMMTFKMMLKGHMSHAETSADTEQVQLKSAPLAAVHAASIATASMCNTPQARHSKT